jgi:hypothetical protein
MRCKREVLTTGSAERAQAIGRARNIGQRIATMIELGFQTPMGNHLCSFCGPNSRVRLHQTFVQRQGAAA